MSRKPTTSLVCLLLLGCAGTETGNPPLTGDSYTSAPLVASADPNDEPMVRIDELFVSFADVRVLSGPGCARLTVDRAADRRVADLLASTPLGALPATDDACGIRVALQQAEVGDGIPDRLVGSVVWIRGERSDGARVEIRATELDPWELRAPDPFALDVATIFAVDLATLVEGTAVADAAPDADGVVRIDGAGLGPALRSAGRLYVDVDADGRLGAIDLAADELAHHE